MAKPEREKQNPLTDERALPPETYIGATGTGLIPDFPTADPVDASMMAPDEGDGGWPVPPPPGSEPSPQRNEPIVETVPPPFSSGGMKVYDFAEDSPSPAPDAKYSAPESTPDEYNFQVVITKGEEGLGVDLSPHDMKTLLIGRIKSGAIMDFNAVQPEGAIDLVMRGDRIVSVNGASGTADAILAKMRQDTALTMTLRRKLLVVIPRLNCGNLDLGLHFKADDALVVESIEERSAIGKSNRMGSSDYEVRIGDVLIEANGETEPAKILREVATQRQFSLKLRRSQGAPKAGY